MWLVMGGWVARFFDERVQRFSTWPAMLPGPSKKDCDELDESTWPERYRGGIGEM